jgi:hypothetical protein
MIRSRFTEFLFIYLLCMAGMFLFADPLPAEQMVTANSIDFGIASVEDFDAGYLLALRIPVFWESDVPWQLTIGSNDPDLGTSRDGNNFKPLSELSWKISEDSVWTPMEQDSREFAWGDETGSGVIYIDFKLMLGWLNDAPGEYRANLVFTIAPL